MALNDRCFAIIPYLTLHVKHILSVWNRVDLIELLASHGADMRKVDAQGKNARDIAEFYGQEAVLKYLASHSFK